MTLGEFQRVKIKLSMNERISKSQIENRIEHSNSGRKAYKLHVDCMQITCKSHGQRAKGRIVNRSQMRDPHASPTESSHHPQNPRILSYAHHPHNPRILSHMHHPQNPCRLLHLHHPQNPCWLSNAHHPQNSRTLSHAHHPKNQQCVGNISLR